MRGGDEPGGAELPGGPGGPTVAWVRRLDGQADRAIERLRDDRLCWALLALAIVVYAAVDLYVTRGTTFFVDEIDLFAVDRGFDLTALLTPLNGHLVLVERLIYAIDFKLLGAQWLPIRIAQVVGASTAVALAFEFARRRVGGAAALGPAVLLLFLGAAWELNFMVSGLGNVYAVAAGLAALLALDRADARGDVLAACLLVISVVSFTLGAAFAVGTLLTVLLQPGARRRVWVALVPLGIYAAWLAWVRIDFLPHHPGAQNLRFENLLLAPNFIANEAASVAGALAGLDYPFTGQDFFTVFATESAYGPVLAALAVAALVMRLRRPGTPLLWGTLAALLVFWLELALGYGIGRNPTIVRYVYGGAVLVAVVTAEAARATRPSNRALLVVYVLVGCALLTNIARLRDGVRFFRGAAITVRADLTAIEIARDRVRPDYLNTGSALEPVVAGPYLAGVDRVGSPAFTEAELLRQAEAVRRSADGVLISAERIRLVPGSATQPLGPCTTLRSPGPSVSFPAGPKGVALTASEPAQASLRRFASSGSAPIGAVPAGRRVDLAIPSDRSKRPWLMTVAPAPARLSVCPIR